MAKFKFNFKVFLFTAAILALLLIYPLIGFRYPNIIENQPMISPVKVVKVAPEYLELQDSRKIYLDANNKSDWHKLLKQSNYFVQIEGESNFVKIYAKQDGWVCYTPWASPIVIPLFQDTVYKNKVELVGLGRYR